MTGAATGGSLHRLLREAAARRPDAPFVVGWPDRLDGTEPGAVPAAVADRPRHPTVSYAQAVGLTDGIAAALRARGLRRADRVLAVLPNGLDLALLLFAAARAGLVLVPLNPALTDVEAARLIAHARPRLVVARAERAERLGGLPSGTDTLPLGPPPHASDLAMLGAGLGDPPTDPMPSDAPLAVLFTSGSTGTPKGCVLTHESYVLPAREFVGRIGLTEQDVALCVLPLYHLAGQSFLTAAVAAGAPVALTEKFRGSRFWLDVADSGATVFRHLGEMLVVLCRQPPSPAEAGHSLRLVYGGGSRVEVARRFTERFGVPVVEGYGLSETNTVLCHDGRTPHRGTLGPPLGHVQTRLVDQSAADVPAGAAGEILVRRNPAMMLGYFEAPELTAAAFVGDWFRTGDLAYRDANGELHFLGRAVETIRRRGENIDPREIEQAVESHPAVTRAAAVAVRDGIGDCAIGVFATARPGAAVHPVDVSAHVAELLAPFKRPRHVAVLPALPTTSTEKIDRVELRRRLAAALAEPRAACTSRPAQRVVRSESWREETVHLVRRALGQRRDEVEEAAVQLLGVTRRVARADIALTDARLAAFGELSAPLAGREPVGVVALGLPGNAILSNPVTAVLSAVLAGNRVRVRLPARAGAWADLVAGLLGPVTPEVEFVGTDGASFLAESFHCPEVGAVMAFGSDTWAGRYDDLARTTGTRFVFEGPGNDPFLVLDASCVDEAAADAVEAAFYNAGQACTSPERFLVVEDAYEPFLRRVVELTNQLAVGDPACPQTQVGPLADQRRADRVLHVVRDAVFRGAEVLTGGASSTDIPVAGRQLPLVPPTVLAGVPPDAVAMREETFGPVIAVHRAGSVAEAVRLAEESRYGLAASVFGGDPSVPARLSRSHGRVFVGETWLGHGRRQPLAAFGGRKQSGWVCEWRGEEFVRRDGPRIPALEFSRPPPAAR